MFHDISTEISARMRELEELDAADRVDGTPRLRRLRQIPPQTGQFIALLAAQAPEGALIEVGTSAGYSTLWLSLAGRVRGRRVTTYEVLDDKVVLARDTFRAAHVDDIVDLVHGDARKYLATMSDIAFCFLDAEKEIYGDIYELVVPRLVSGGFLVADNAINHRETLQPMLDRALTDVRVDAMIVPIEKGELVCRKL